MTAPSSLTQMVVVGSSAGGVEALMTLAGTLPAAFPAPIVVAQHLDPARPSHLQEILARHSPLPVRTVTGEETLEAGVIYVVPADEHVLVSDHHLRLDHTGGSRPKPSIDLLFASAAAVFGEGLIAVVLTGLGSDGAAGVQRVKEAGGAVVIQNPQTAAYPAMPRAVAPTMVDAMADADALGPLLYDLLTGAYTPIEQGDDRQLRQLLEELHAHTGIDFGRYKDGTIARRLQRRLVATGAHTVAAYRTYLSAHPEEYDRLVSAFLIKVTEFFRDADIFAVLRAEVVPALVAYGRAHTRELRIWSAGCATGEEAYSLAVLIAEALGPELESWSVRIFATDLDSAAVDFARRGAYPAAALAEVPSELVARYFVAREGSYYVSPRVRGLVVFGEHDLGRRAPFPRLDLVLCRNVLIYFTAELQEHALELFAYGLREGGYLVLGQAESAGAQTRYFVPLQPGLRAYRREGGRAPVPLPQYRARLPSVRSGRAAVFPMAPSAAGRRPAATPAPRGENGEEVLLRLPVGVVEVDRHYDIRRINTAGRRLLGIHGAAVGEDVMHHARTVPLDLLRRLVDAAMEGETQNEEVPTGALVPGETHYLQLSAVPHVAVDGEGPQEAGVLLVITDTTASTVARRAAQEEATHTQQLVVELRAANRALLAANEELTSGNQHLRASNVDAVLGTATMQVAAEEMETLNEELQAANEELETLNEEQQATVEELETTNDELRARHQEAQALVESLALQRGQLTALLNSMSEAVVLLNAAGQTVFTNAAFTQLFGQAGAALVPEDAEGRPLPLEEWPQQRLRQGHPLEGEVILRGADGRRGRYALRGHPMQAGVPAAEIVVILRPAGAAPETSTAADHEDVLGPRVARGGPGEDV